MSSASIVLLTYNGEKYLRSVLHMIGRQKEQPSEIIAIDSSSTDSTVDILKGYGIHPRIIAKQEFGHASTRNMGVQMCSGKYVVFLTQDAVPADACWLERLLTPMQGSPEIVASYSRQIPRPDSSLLEANDLSQDFPNRSATQKLSPETRMDRKQIWNLIRFSNSSSAYERKVLLENPFNESLNMAEDQDWVKRIVERGCAVAYEASSVVVHSHEHNWSEKYGRSLQMGAAFSQFLGPMLGRRSILLEFGAWLAHMFLDLRYISTCEATFKSKLKWLLLSPILRAGIHYAYRKGWNSAFTVRSAVEETLDPNPLKNVTG